MTSAQIGEPPSASKLDLIRRFLRAAGIQQQIDTGSFLDRFAFPGSPLVASAAFDGCTFREAGKRAFGALREAYAKHRNFWQDEYESHVNWEFTEAELEEIVAFLERPAGKHYLEGRWRMDAYIGTNTEDLIEDIICEAKAALAGDPEGKSFR